jgi:hypothetical protein
MSRRSTGLQLDKDSRILQYVIYCIFKSSSYRTGARFSVRISAVEVVGKSENLKDLLGEQGNGSMCSSTGGTSPSVYLPRERASSIQVRNTDIFLIL